MLSFDPVSKSAAMGSKGRHLSGGKREGGKKGGGKMGGIKGGKGSGWVVKGWSGAWGGGGGGGVHEERDGVAQHVFDEEAAQLVGKPGDLRREQAVGGLGLISKRWGSARAMGL